MNRLEETAKQRGLSIFARIDHAGGAAKVGKTLRPAELLIFGNPAGSTPFIECAQSVGIDLPLSPPIGGTLQNTMQAQLGLSVYVDDLAQKAENATRSLRERQIRFMRGVFRAM